ncbi:hypothetical protein ACOJBO_30330 [Rhizobium beringeri]
MALVDLPEPFGPISVTISPRATEKSTPRTSQRPLRRMPTSSSETSGSALIPAGVFAGESIKFSESAVASCYCTRYSITQLM